MRILPSRQTVGVLVVLLVVAAGAGSWLEKDSDAKVIPARKNVAAASPSPAAALELQPNPLRNAYFGDLHVHTSWSLDAYNGGNRLHGPAEAYRYGRGDVVSGPNGREQLRAPLDFMAVTDHDSFLAEAAMCDDPSDAAYTSQICRDVRSDAAPRLTTATYTAEFRHHPEICGEGDQSRCIERAAHRWHDVQRIAHEFYQPGMFTTFAAYEWTGMREVENGAHLHRNVIFRGTSVPEWGGSAVEMEHRPERLWAWLERACTGDCEVLAIPHNTNYSMGVAFDTKNTDGTPFTPQILRRRAWLEPVVEIHQVKGASECAVGLGATDEECDFEQVFQPCRPEQVGRRCAFASDFVRNALKSGLQVEEQQGVNPFKYGFIGSTDTHRSSSGATDEQPGNISGVIGDTPAPRRTDRDASPLAGRRNPGGLAGVWAEENTREHIFDALRRREVFATSGTRIRVRFFGGWNYSESLHTSRTLVEDAYGDGVPMGGDLPARPSTEATPRFIVWAARDAGSADLQKIQIIKGWAEPGGTSAEQVFDVACTGGLEPDARTHRCADNDARVDLSDCSYSSDRGAAELSTTWADPTFDPSLRAFYYVRVLENPTCRWSTRLALATNSSPPAGEAAVIRERAWSSPIWYTPAGR